MAINRKQEEREKNRHVWRMDFSLLEKDFLNSEIGSEVKKHYGFYKWGLLIGGFCIGVLLLYLIALLICHAKLFYIKLFYIKLFYIKLLGITVFLLGLMYGMVLKIPKISRRDLKKMEDELNIKSDRLEEFNAIFTENTLIVLKGILVYRISYLEIASITIEQRGTSVKGGLYFHYRLCDGSYVYIIYAGVLFKSIDFVPLLERLLKYNPDILISIYKNGKREIPEEK